MRKHPLLAFATTSLSLSFGALLHGAFAAPAQGSSVLGSSGSHSNTAYKSNGSQSVTLKDISLTSYSAPAKRRPARRHHLTNAQQLHRAALVHRRLHHAERELQLLRRGAAIVSKETQPLPPEATGVWASLRSCESGGVYSTNTGNGYYGAYQFSLASWRLLGYGGLPSQAAPEVQDRAAKALAARQGWNAWPHCSWALGLA